MEDFVSPNMLIELTSSKGMQFELDEIAYNLYTEYERMTGFNIRKEYVNKCKKDGNCYFKEICVWEWGNLGHRQARYMVKQGNLKRKQDVDACNACLVIVYNWDSDKYIVTDFIVDHNHNLHLSTTVHMMPLITTENLYNSSCWDWFGIWIRFKTKGFLSVCK
jgi:hypothetical protein